MNWYKQSKKSQEDREYPVAAVVIADGIKFEGRTHGEAIQKGKDAGHIHKDENGYLMDSSGNDMTFSGAIDLFRTNKGRVINRFKAYELGGAVSAEDIPEHELDVKEAAIGGSTTPSPSVPMTSMPMSEDVAISPRQIYTRDDVIQNRDDLAPSMLRKKKKRNKK